VTTYTSRGIPILEPTDAADIPARVNPLAQLVHDRPGISTLTTTQRNALTGIELWHGRVILNSSIDRLQRYQLSTNTWFDVADFTEIAALLATTGTPAAIGTASRGTSTSAARADHVHPGPPFTTVTTPNFPNFPINAAQSFVRFQRNGTLITVHFAVTASAAITGQILMDLPTVPLQPLGANTTSGFQTWGNAMATKVAGSTLPLVIYYGSGVTQRAAFMTPTGTVAAATVPFTWAAGDILAGTFKYEAAS
jgi:hypothetical protein